MCAKSTETTELAALWFEPRHQRLVRIGPSRAVRDCEDQTYAGVDYIGNHVVTSGADAGTGMERAHGSGRTLGVLSRSLTPPFFWLSGRILSSRLSTRPVPAHPPDLSGRLAALGGSRGSGCATTRSCRKDSAHTAGSAE